MRNTFKIPLIILLCFLTHTGYGEECCPENHLSVGATWLYLRPSGGPQDFAAIRGSLTEGPKVQEIFVAPDYKSGYQINVSYQVNCTDTIGFVYTRYDQTFHQSVSALGEVFPVDAGPYTGIMCDSGFGKMFYDYTTYDICFGRTLCWGSYLATKFFAGIRYLDLDVGNDNSYITSENGTLILHGVRSDFWGAGPFVGIEGTYDLTCSFSVTGRSFCGLLSGSYDIFGSGFNPDAIEFRTPVNRTDDKHTLIPFIDMSVALQYTFPFRCFPTVLQAGYTLIYYNDIFKRAGSPRDGRPTASTNVDFSGGFVQVCVQIW